MKKILFIILICLRFNLLAQIDPDYPADYTPLNNIRSIRAYPAPILAINGQYGIWFKTGIKNLIEENRVTRPFIICEGFDVANDQELPFLYSQLNNNSVINNALTVINPGFLDDLRCAGYDVIILNLGSNTKAIQENAELFIKLITYLSNQLIIYYI